MVNKLQRKDKTKKSKGFVYKGRSAETIKKIAEQSGGRFDSILKGGTDTFTPHVGENTVRILPPTWDSDYFGLTVWVHSRIGEDNSTYLCLKKMKGKDCPICAAAKEAKDDGEEDEAKALRNNERFLYYVIDRKEKEPSPAVWNASWTQNRDIADACRNMKTGKVLLIDHPDEGYDLSFRRTGQGLKTKYGAPQVDRDKSPISDDDDEQTEILETIEANPLPDLLHYYDAEYLEKVLSGGGKKDEELDDDEDGDEEEKPSKRKKRGDEDEDEEEDRPKKKKPAADEEDDDGEEEDEKPKKKKRVARRRRTRRRTKNLPAGAVGARRTKKKLARTKPAMATATATRRKTRSLREANVLVVGPTMTRTRRTRSRRRRSLPPTKKKMTAAMRMRRTRSLRVVVARPMKMRRRTRSRNVARRATKKKMTAKKKMRSRSAVAPPKKMRTRRTRSRKRNA
jgi:hypothetical protein